MKPSDDLIVSSTEPTGLNRKKVWMQKGKNLFDKDNFVMRYSFINASTGEIIQYNNVTQMFILPIKCGQTYTISKVAGKHFRAGTTSEYPADGITVNKLNVNNNGTSITISAGSDDKYLVCSYYQKGTDTLTATEVQETIQVEQNSTATEYEEYIEPKIYVRNENNVYEEFEQEYDSGWLYLTELGESYSYIKYRKVGKIVELISPLYSKKGFSISAFGTTLLGTLPEGFRPSQKRHIPIVCKNTSNLIIDYCFVDIQTDGSIILSNITDSSDTAVCLVYFATTFFVD